MGPGGDCAECRRNGLGVQTKLMINEPGDKYEQQADRIADQVMRMPEPGIQHQVDPAEEEETIQAKPLAQRRAANQTTPISEPFTIKDVLSSPGQAMDAATREFMESRFGHDFSQVRLHTDAKAAVSAKGINARAYTVGHDVVFGAGQYNTSTDAGRHLLAHELAHTIQQGRGAAERVQREIYIGGRIFGPDETWRENLVKKHGEEGLQIYYKMNKPGVQYDYFDKELLLTEIQLRVEAIKRMRSNEIDWKCCGYRDADNPNYYLDSAFWEPTSKKSDTMPHAPPLSRGSYQPDFRLKKGVQPSEAIEAVFKSGARTTLECRSMMVAIQYYAMLKAYGEDKFNTMFGVDNLIVGRYMDPADPSKPRHPLAEYKMMVPVEVAVPRGDEAANLIPGDWVYFKNHPDYPRGAGDWSGEWSMYMGNGMFSGFGLRQELTFEDETIIQFAYTYEEVKEQLLKEYLKVAPSGVTATRNDIPGIETSTGMTRVLRPNP